MLNEFYFLTIYCPTMRKIQSSLKQGVTHEVFKVPFKRALVTGSGRGIGAAIAKLMARFGVEVVLHASKLSEELEATHDAIIKEGGKALMLTGDWSDEVEAGSVMHQIRKDIGVLDVLVNNAADQSVKALTDLSYLDVANMMAVNLVAPIMLTQQLMKHHQPSPSNPACIVNIASIEALRGRLGHSHYAATKAGLMQFNQVAALELAAQGVRVNAVCPGLIDCPGLSEAWPEGVASWLAHAPLSRLGRPEDVARVVMFLCSDAAQFITGSCITVDGGMTCAPGW